jgi:hypothetical protein
MFHPSERARPCETEANGATSRAGLRALTRNKTNESLTLDVREVFRTERFKTNHGKRGGGVVEAWRRRGRGVADGGSRIVKSKFT